MHAQGGVPSAVAEEGVPPVQAALLEPEPQLALRSTNEICGGSSFNAEGGVGTRRPPQMALDDEEFPDEALALVCSFVDLRQLGRLACVSQRFTQLVLTEPESGAKLSVVQEGARLQFMAAAACAASGMVATEKTDCETWMEALWRTQYCLRWNKLHSRVEAAEDGRLAVLRAPGVGMSYASVLADQVLEADGDAYAKFTYVSDPGGTNLFAGLARPDVDVSTALPDGVAGSEHGWMYRAHTGQFRHGLGRVTCPWFSGEGKRFTQGMTLGLRLRHGSLSADIDGQQLGVMCTELQGKFVWAADLGRPTESVRIVRSKPPQDMVM